MTLAAGTKLGPYEIIAPIGAGGMGEVYKARDTRLERTVAVKVLPQHLSASPEVRQRFEREAKTISQLSQPHICALYDVGREGEIDYLVMEYLEGEMLSDRLSKGALPLEQTLRYGTQIAEALEKAHRQGVVHRDLKPGNVMLTRSGVKLLDFGLAKAMAAPNATSGLTSFPTAVGGPNLTREGTILGTFQYMAPEQLEGKEADARADIFAFGTVLYEMATGTKAFSGTSQASLISSIMKEEPAPISVIAPMSPPALDRVVRTCLSKDPDDRWQTAHDVGVQLKWILEGGSGVGVPAPVVAKRKNRERIAWASAAILLALLAASLLLPRKAPSPNSVLRTSVAGPEKQFIGFLALSPDGRRLAFVAAPPGGKRSLWVRPLDELAAKRLDGTENADFPFWSPDSGSIGFFADAKLKRVDAGGGAVVTLCDASPNGLGGTWNREGTILFGLPSRPIHRVADSGGASEPVTQLDASRRETSHRYPQFLPDGRRFLYLAANLAGAPDDPANQINVASLDGGVSRPVLPASSNAVYASGHLLFVRDGNLLAQGFDAKRLAPSGSPRPVAQRLELSGLFWRWGLFSASENGLVAYSPALLASSRLVWFDRFGREAGSVGEPAAFVTSPRLSPDGRRLAVAILDSALNKRDVWLYDLGRSVRTRLTSGPSVNDAPVWSPDGLRIVFTTDRKHQGDLYTKASTGHGVEEPFLEGEGQRIADDWSPDGKSLAVEIREPRGERKVALTIVPASGEGTPKIFFQRSVNLGEARFSPDGRAIAYTSEESGRSEIYLAEFPGPGTRSQVSPDGGVSPRWGRSGRELFYLAEDGALMAVEVRTAGALETGVPVKLFVPHPRALDYDVSADGQRFLIVASGAESSPPINLVQNWTGVK